MSPMRLKPARAMSARVWSSRPSAASGRSWKSLAKALSLKGSGAIFACENRASAQAARGLPATPAATETPCAVSRARQSSMSAASPPKRCATPEMSSISPSRPSSAARGVKREHQSQRRSRSRASSAGSASTATRAGKRARASASGRPTVNPSRAASASTPTSRRALSILATAASGAALSTPMSRRARSVASRGSQRERNRRIVKSQFLENHRLASPFQTENARWIESLQPRSIGRPEGRPSFDGL